MFDKQSESMILSYDEVELIQKEAIHREYFMESAGVRHLRTSC